MNDPITIWTLEDARKYHVHSPGLAQWLCANLDKSQFVWDFGCGLGSYVKALREAGFKADGFEGTPGINQIADTAVIQRDITKSFPKMWADKKGTVMCLEVMEHLLPEQEATVIHNLMQFCANTLVLSWAIPGQPGHGHNNCRTNEYVINLVRHWRFKLDSTLTDSARQSIGKSAGFFKNTLMIFKR